MNKADHLARMVREISSAIEIRASAPCHFCGQVGTWVSNDFCDAGTEREAMQDAAEHLFALGWRIVSSREYQVSSVLRCPDCKGEI